MSKFKAQLTVKLIENSIFDYKYELLSVPDDKFPKNILICLVYSSIDPYLVFDNGRIIGKKLNWLVVNWV